MEGLDVSTIKIVSILLFQQQISLLNLIKRRQYQIQGFTAFLSTLKTQYDHTYLSFKGTDPRKTLIFLKIIWRLDPRITKLCFSNSMPWYILKQPFKGVMQKSCSQNFREIHMKTSVVQTLINKVAGFQAATLLKKVPTTGVFL